jgi:CDP-diacylglycerol--serine O-phosphatidyltransferase
VILVVALVGGALFTAPWPTLSVISAIYVLMIPFSILSYSKVRKQRAAAAASSE